MWNDSEKSVASALRRLVAGYPSIKRKKKPLVFLQSYADDSVGHKGDERLFMAGFFGRVDLWEQFSDDWQYVLDEHPKINYLKMVEAQNLRGEFRYWSEADRDRKLLRFCDVIQSYPLGSFDFSVSCKVYRDLVKPHAPRGLADPHFAANFHTVSGLAQYFQDEANLKIEFVFDTQKGVDEDVRLFFEYMCRDLPKKARDRISGIPLFRDDKELVPLQAADMAAWSLRREHQMGRDSLPIPINRVITSHHIRSAITDDALERWGREFEKTGAARLLQSKGQWQDFRNELSDLLATGFVPPNGTTLQNMIDDFRKRFARFIDS